MTTKTDRRARYGTHRFLHPWLLLCALLGFSCAHAQQFNSDNQWTAPHGVSTLVATVGQEYSALLAVAALGEGWEWNIGATRFDEDRGRHTDAHYSGIFYVKHRVWENEAATGGFAWMAGTGISPSYLSEGEVTDTFQSWWANAIFTFPFRDGTVTWDVLPGFTANFNRDLEGESAWNMAYSTRVAVYKIIPQSAIVGEVFGTTGEDHADPQYRIGVRWESKRVIIAATYGRGFDGTGGPRFELGFMMFTNPIKLLCVGGGC